MLYFYLRTASKYYYAAKSTNSHLATINTRTEPNTITIMKTC